MMGNMRLPGLDVVRSLAIFFVIGGHFFFLHTNYRTISFEGWNLFFQGICASLFLVSVPLFLLLTGYLNCNKCLSIGYYKGIIRIIVAYWVYCIISILYRHFFCGESYSVLVWIKKILNFSVVNYSWYIEMYIGLFILIPFLNIIYNNLQQKKGKQILILTFLILTALPPFINRVGYKFVPDNFVALYPVTFYFIGAYIHEYKFKFGKLKLLLILLFLCMLDPMINLIRGDARISVLGGRDSLFYTAIAVIVFLLFYDVDFKSKLITKISLLSLDMYLCSWIFDNLYYGYFKTRCFESQQQFFAFFPIIVPLVFFSSFGVAWLREKASLGLKRIFVKQSV